MAEPKTKQTEADVIEFIMSFAETEQKQKDSFELVKLMQKVTGHEPKMWGPSIIGFGEYHYKGLKKKCKLGFVSVLDGSKVREGRILSQDIFDKF